MSWNYRITRQLIYRDLDNDIEDEYIYEIHEVYYKNNKIDAWSVNPIYASGINLKELRDDLNLMKLAFNKPILEFYYNKKGEKKLREVK